MSYSARRSNKSHRVPNVKLRPVQPSKRRTPPPLSTPTSSPPQPSHSHDEGLSGSFIDPCPRPLRGVVLCATGVDKSEVFSKAQELGASTSYDFTDRVTHLIAEGAAGMKYQCAVERQIPILRPSWVFENYEIWLRGDMFDLAESIEDHRLPIFDKVVLCLSGFQDVAQRTEINRLVTKHGGQYVKELRRPVKVTHLLCTGDEETEKMRYARRFNEAGEARIRLVWEEWLSDCVNYGGRFSEEPYSVDLPRPPPKPLTQQPTHSQIGHALESFSGPHIAAPATAQSSNQAEEDEEAPVRTHVPAVTLQVWESLLKTRGYVRDGAKLVRSPTKPKPSQPFNAEMDVDDELPQPQAISQAYKAPTRAELAKGAAQAELHPDRKGHSALASFTRTGSFTASKLADESTSKQPFRRSQSVFARASPAPQLSAGPSKPAQLGDGEKVFSGMKFRALGEAKSASVRSAIESCGGAMAGDDVDDEGVDYIIVRLVSAIFRAEQDEALRQKYRTECWLEGCLSTSTLLSPTHHPTFLPLPHFLPLVNSHQILLSHSGLDAAEETWIKRLVRALGMSHAAVFSRSCTHLLCPAQRGMKWEKAREWGVEVVGMEWFERIISTGLIPVREGEGEEKGKGKERMADVTNTKVDGRALGVQKARTVPDLSAPPRAPSRAASLQKQAMERARTAPVDQDEPLGKQSLLLSSHPKAPTPAPRTRTTTPAPPTRLSTPQQKLADSGSDTEPEEDELPSVLPPPSALTGVPSSRTPSPLKMPPSQPRSHHPSSSPHPGPASSPAPPPRSSPAAGSSPLKPHTSSPMRPIIPPAAARALHESMSVLGKRTSESHLDEPDPPRRRRRPRPRPAAPKEKEREGSGVRIPEVYDTSASYEIPSALLGMGMGLDGGMGGFGAGGGGKGRGTVVTYEDAGMRVERLRLMSLLGDDDDDDDDDEVEIVENPVVVPVQKPQDRAGQAGQAGGSKPKPRPRMVGRGGRADGS